MTAGIGDLIRYLSPDEQAEAHALMTESDPLKRLLDPDFKRVTWEYEFSRSGLSIPGQLHPKQAEALTSTAKNRWLFWGNQVGKTTLGAVDLVLLCLGRHPVQKWKPPVHCWASALTWELWQNILLPELLTWIPPDRLIDAPPPNAQSTKRDIIIRADNGTESRITGKAAEQGASRYQSARIHRFWGDEEHPQDVMDEVKARLLRNSGDTINTMTPLKGMTWVYTRVYEKWKTGQTSPDEHYISHAGLADNPSITQEVRDALAKSLQHNPSQLAARMHGQFVRPSGLVLSFDADKMSEVIGPGSVGTWLKNGGRAHATMDFGYFRFAFGLAIETPDGELRLIEELFSQCESIDVRARKIHRLMTERGIPPDTYIGGDCANPTDINEFNAAFQRIGSQYRVYSVEGSDKIVQTGIDRLASLLARGAFKVRRGIGEGQTWYLGKTTQTQGDPISGSRWLWEINNWQYPKMPDGKSQKDVPDDDSADGADMMDMTRYMVMSWWERNKKRLEKKRKHEDQHPGYNFKEKRVADWPKEEPEREYRMPEFHLPRWNDED